MRESGRVREIGRERNPSRFHSVSTLPDEGLSFMNKVTMNQAQIKSQMLIRLNYPGAVEDKLFYLINLLGFHVEKKKNFNVFLRLYAKLNSRQIDELSVYSNMMQLVE